MPFEVTVETTNVFVSIKIIFFSAITISWTDNTQLASSKVTESSSDAFAMPILALCR